LVNDLTSTDGNDKASQAPRSLEELESLKELVSSAVGFDESRGDIITIKSMALQSVPASGTAADISIFSRVNIDIMSAIQMMVLATVTLVLGLFVVRPLLSKEISGRIEGQHALADQRDGDRNPNLATKAADNHEFGRLDTPNLSTFQESNDQGDFNATGNSVEDPVERLQKMIGDRQEETVEILRGWLDEKEERV
jgi:flagellar M-ring protein FliF